MSSNIRITRICQHCGNDFEARTTVTRYCGDHCAKRAYKARKRAEKVEFSNSETQRIITNPIKGLMVKEFLSVTDACQLTGVSRRTLYRMIERGELYIGKFGKRTIIKRSEIDKLFEQPQPVQPQINRQSRKFDINECYNLTEIQLNYNISDKALQGLIKRNNITKFRNGKFAYVPKKEFDNFFNQSKNDNDKSKTKAKADFREQA